MSLDATRTPRQWTTPREKLKLVLDRRKSLILKREDATRYRSACKRLSYLAQDKWDFAEPRSIWPRECVNVVNSSLFHRNVHRDISMGSTKLCCVFEDKNTLTKSQSSWTAFSVAIEKKIQRGLLAQIGKHTVRPGSTLPSLTALSVGDAEF